MLKKLPGAASGVKSIDLGFSFGPDIKVVVEAKRSGSLIQALGEAETGSYDDLLRKQTQYDVAAMLTRNDASGDLHATRFSTRVVLIAFCLEDVSIN